MRRYIERAIHQYGQVVSLPQEESIASIWKTEYAIDELLSDTEDRHHELEKNEWQMEAMEKIEKTIQTLTKREEIVVRYMYGIGVKKHTAKWLATRLGMEYEAVKKMGKRALRKIQKKCR